MNVDEMDLVSQLKDAEPLRPEAYERARTTLLAAMAEPGPAPVPEVVPLRRARNRRRATVGTLGKVGIGAGIGAVAAGVAVALVATSTAQPASPAHFAAPASKAPAVNSKLVSLAAFVKASSGNLPGNASLVIQTQALTGIPAQVTYNLYTDSGGYYGSNDKKGLTAAVRHHQNLAGSWLDARQVVAAARYAATGNLTTARQRMLNATPEQFERLLRDTPAARKKLWEKDMAKARAIFRAKHVKPPAVPTDKILRTDINYEIWYNSVNALTEGAGNPQVREGVLRLLSTISEITVANSTTGGRSTLTLTASPAMNPGSGLPAQVVTIDARTGMPISSVWGTPGQKYYSNTTFRVSRVTLAAVRAGRF